VAARLLRSELLQPALDVAAINARLDAVAELIQDEAAMAGLARILGEIPEVYHIISRLCIQVTVGG
jgi:DNA mismatch repair ATPase MutS